MKKVLYKLFIILLVIMVTLSFGTSAYAGWGGSGEEEDAPAGSGSSTQPYRISTHTNGYLCYIVHKNRALATEYSDVKFVKNPDGAMWPSGSLNLLRERFTGSSPSSIYPGKIGDATLGKFNKPPFNVTTGEGYGAQLKSALLSHTGTGGQPLAKDFIGNLWGSGAAEKFVDSAFLTGSIEDGDVLCIEAVSWQGLKGSTASPGNKFAVVTAYTAKDILHISTWAAHHLRYRLQVCGYLSPGWIGQADGTTNGGSNLSDAQISNPRSGQGIIMIRAAELGEPEEEPDPVEFEGSDYLLANELNRGFTDLIESHNDGRNWDEYEKYFDIARFFENSNNWV